jgi:hypothetical protein
MKLLLYRGGCASKTVHGIKFTQYVRTANVSDEVANKFKGMTDFNVIDLKKKDIVKDDEKDKDVNTNEDEDLEIDSEVTDEEEPDIDEIKVKKFMKLNLDTLREMCEAKGLDSEGTKQKLATRLSSN